MVQLWRVRLLTSRCSIIVSSNGRLARGTDKATALAVYCRSGNMSAKAVVDLRSLGYTNISELKGGYNAWKAAGRTLEPK